jgi:hypothetical protein
LLLSPSAPLRAMIMKDPCTHTTIILRHDKTLRDHRPEHRIAARPR